MWAIYTGLLLHPVTIVNRDRDVGPGVGDGPGKGAEELSQASLPPHELQGTPPGQYSAGDE